MTFSFGCSLAYHVQTPTALVFNLEAARFDGQTLTLERLAMTPELAVERWTMPESGNRYLRVIAQPGDLRIRYEAKATLSPRLEDPASVVEIPAERLPFSVFPHLYPSRYCQSDKLERFAQRTFGDLPGGYQRVNAICNWIRDHVDYISGSSDALTSAIVSHRVV